MAAGETPGSVTDMTRTSRLLVAAAALMLVGLFFLPIWHIKLIAPQYPEGLGMQIRINTIVGDTPHDLQNINGLNHYIGMRAIEPDAIPELRFMPWIVGALIVTGLVVAARGRRPALYAWAGTFLAAAIAGMVDFWKWGYEYGHNLDPETAIIKIPGMSYQPPLIGTKQLLNFTATSWPSIGGWLAVLAGVAATAAVVLTLRARRRAGQAAPLVVAAEAEPEAVHA